MAAEPSTVIRVAIAFAALKHKPRDQSTASYVLDLQSQFPLASQTISSQTQDSAKRWRAHALRLESELKEIQARQDVDQQELVQLRHDVAQTQAQQQEKESSSQPPRKKAKKKHKQQDPNEPTWNWDMVRTGERQDFYKLPLCLARFFTLTDDYLGWSNFIHSLYPPGPSLLIAYNSLHGALLSSHSAPSSETHKEGHVETYVCRLADAMIRAVEAIYAFLFVKGGDNPIVAATSSPTVGSLPSQISSQQPSAHSTPALSAPSASVGGRYENLTCASIAMCYPLLAYTLTTTFPALLKACEDLTSLHASDSVRGTFPHVSSEKPRCQEISGYHQINRVIDVLLELILLPFVRAFRPLCWARLLAVIEGADAVVNVSANTDPTADTARREKGKAKEKRPKGKRTGEATKAREGKGKANQRAKDKGTPARDPGLAGRSIPAPSDSLSHPAPANVCIDVLALLGMAAHALESLSSSTAQASSLTIACSMSTGVRERLALEAIRELEALYSIPVDNATSSPDCTLPQTNRSYLPHTANTAACSPTMPSPTQNTPTPHTFSACESTATHNALNTENPNLQAAVHKAKGAYRENLFRTLSTKDAAWYLCSVLYLAISPPTNPVTSGDAPGLWSMPVAGSASLRADANPRTAGSASPLPSSALLTRAVVAGIGRLLYFAVPAIGDGDAAAGPNSSTLIDPITRNILLAICERALKGYAEVDQELLE
ncbi:hypothetical protein PISMIDRAFT_11106 [Pisolithus microcarpus 441]|uniref:Uncharacterized protein n=1 Tax=Pisolithus microcarpus 441 TaxID=765257 RepID=A0A0C9ZL45_9AGAM|nr:hypothetical protein PISMIDRAFT_11106 [Pisolithus microcarpus 441]